MEEIKATQEMANSPHAINVDEWANGLWWFSSIQLSPTRTALLDSNDFVCTRMASPQPDLRLGLHGTRFSNSVSSPSWLGLGFRDLLQQLGRPRLSPNWKLVTPPVDRMRQ